MKNLIRVLAALLVATAFGGAAAGLRMPWSSEADDVCVLGFCKGEIPDVEGRVLSLFGMEAKGKMSGMDFATVSYGSFDQGVTVFWTENQGVCAVAGGTSTTKIEELKGMLAQKYGEPSARRRGMWPSTAMPWPGERGAGFLWSSEEGAKLPKGMLAIKAWAEFSITIVEYEFTNFPQCAEEGKADFGADL